MNCDACGLKSSSWSYHGTGGKEQNFLQKFIVGKSGKEIRGNEFELCGNCQKEWKEFLSRELKEEMIKELTAKNAVDCEILSQYAYNIYLLGNDYQEVWRELAKNIKKNRKEWQIKEVDWNKDRKHYFDDVEQNKKISKKIILIHQSATMEYSLNGFLLIKRPKLYLKQDFLPEQWTEIEKVLNEEQQQKNQLGTEKILIILGAITLIIATIILLVYLTKRKKLKK